jgi:hypothetical protein
MTIDNQTRDRSSLRKDLALAASDLGHSRAKFCHHAGRWLLLTRGGKHVGMFVIAVSPRTGKEGLCVLREPIVSFLDAELWAFDVTVCVRAPVAVDREAAEARWQAHLAALQLTAPVVTYDDPRPSKRPRARRKRQLAGRDSQAQV